MTWTETASLITTFCVVTGQCLAVSGYRSDEQRWMWQVRVTGEGHRWQVLAVAAAAAGVSVNAWWVAYIDCGVILVGATVLIRRLRLNRLRRRRTTESSALAERRARREEVNRLWWQQR